MTESGAYVRMKFICNSFEVHRIDLQFAARRYYFRNLQLSRSKSSAPVEHSAILTSWWRVISNQRSFQKLAALSRQGRERLVPPAPKYNRYTVSAAANSSLISRLIKGKWPADRAGRVFQPQRKLEICQCPCPRAYKCAFCSASHPLEATTLRYTN